ncbi:MAG: zf-HC2 domain-containing protein [Anaerolineae bacterium]|jgi:predicted anti-sigma-YlaC factor YlaD
MECVDALELISQRLDGPLGPVEEADLQVHLAQCPRCQSVSRALTQVDAMLVATPALPPPAALSGGVMARVARRARLDRLVRNGLITVLSLALVVVALVLPAVQAVQAAQQSNVFAAVMARMGDDLAQLARAVVSPLVTVVRTVVLGDGYAYLLAWLLLALALVLAWVGVVARVIRPARLEIPSSATAESAPRNGLQIGRS